MDVPSISFRTLKKMRSRGAGDYVYSDDGGVYMCWPHATIARKRGAHGQGTAHKRRQSDCAIYAMATPTVTFSITADQQQTEQLKEGFTALYQAQNALCEACIDFDSKSMTVSEGAALVKSIQDELSASCSPLFAYRDASPAIDSLVQCCDKCLNSLSLLAGNGDASTAAFSSEMKYALLELSSSYSDMLKSMAG